MPLTESEELELLELERERVKPKAPSEEVKAEEPGILERVDAYTGAPPRAAIDALLSGKGLSGAAKAFGENFGADPNNAPTAGDIRKKAGIPSFRVSDAIKTIGGRPGKLLEKALFTDDPKEADKWYRLQRKGPADLDLSETAIGMGADITNLIPFGTIAKVGGKTAKAVAPKATKGFARLAEGLTGVPARETETYIKNRKVVDALAQKYGDDMAAASDEVRRKYMTGIQQKRTTLNKQIADAIKAAGPDATVESGPIVKALDDYKARLDPTLHPSEIAEIESEIAKVNQLAPSGTLPLEKAQQVKQYFQDMATPAYRKAGQVFPVSKDLARASKDATFEARRGVHEVSPEIASANRNLSLLHGIEKRMNKNLIAEGRPEAALLAAGGGNQRNRSILQSLGRLTNQDMVGEADKLAALRRFAKPEFLPVDSTGKTFTRQMAGRALVGAGIAGAAGENPFYGVALSSPFTLKYGIKAGAGAGNLIRGAAQNARNLHTSYALGMAAQRNEQGAARKKEVVMSRVKGTPFEAPLAAAAQRGENGFGATYFLLHQNHPEFRKLVEEDEEK